MLHLLYSLLLATLPVDLALEQYFQEHSVNFEAGHNPIPLIVSTGDQLCALVTAYTPDIPHVPTPSAMATDGCLELGLQLSPQQIGDIRHFLEGEPVYYGHVIRSKEFATPPAPNISQFHGPVGCYSPGSIARCPHLFEFASSPAILNLIETYFGCPATLYDFNILWTFGQHGVHQFHRDTDDFRQVTLFVYLSDVPDDKFGPHTYQKGTQRGASSGPPHSFYGPAGTAFMTDSLGLHKGAAPSKKKSRLIFWARYGLGENALFKQNGSFRDLENTYHISKKAITEHLDLSSPHQQYLWRLFL